MAAQRPSGRLPVVGFNAWDRLSPGDPSDVSVAVVVPTYERPAALRQVLAALAPQLRPGDEVVVVDDGSRPGADEVAAPGGMVLQVLRRPDEGFRAAAARNDGARATTADVVVFLDDDMVPPPGWRDAHAAWHAGVDGLLTVGSRVHVDGPTPAAPLLGEPEHLRAYLALTHDLTAPADDLFRVCSGGNLALRRDLLEAVGGFDEGFAGYGLEDVELGYRLVQHGAVVVPVPDARCTHLGAPGFTDPAKQAAASSRRLWAMDLIAHPGFRSTAPGRAFLRPQVVVGVAVGEGDRAPVVLEAVEAVLASAFTDLVVVVGIPPGHAAREDVAGALRGDGRVSLAGAVGLDAGGSVADTWWRPWSPIHIELSPGVVVAPSAIGRVVDALRRPPRPVGAVHLLGGGGTAVGTAWLTRAVGRARRCGATSPPEVAASVEALFGVRWLPVGELVTTGRAPLPSVEQDLHTIRAAMRRLPDPVVHGLAEGLRLGARVRRRWRSR